MPQINDIVHVCVNEVYRPQYGDYAEAYIDKTYYIVTHIYKNGNVRLWNYFDDKAPGIRVCRSWIKVGTWGDNKNKVFKKNIIKNKTKDELKKLRIYNKELKDALFQARKDLEDIATKAHCIAKAGPTNTPYHHVWNEFNKLSVSATVAITKIRKITDKYK